MDASPHTQAAFCHSQDAVSSGDLINQYQLICFRSNLPDHYNQAAQQSYDTAYVNDPFRVYNAIISRIRISQMNSGEFNSITP